MSGATWALGAQSSSSGFWQQSPIHMGTFSGWVVFGMSFMLGDKCALQGSSGTGI